ncbi:MAG TPA: hypothetical protein VFL36_03745 [Myxococcales bacterium]|nr:hypothetical protein [Myxococcales bacterium]
MNTLLVAALLALAAPDPTHDARGKPRKPRAKKYEVPPRAEEGGR